MMRAGLLLLAAACAGALPARGAMKVPLRPDASWTVSASSQEEGFAAVNVGDGLAHTRWSSAFDDNQWLTIDLGEPEEIHSVLLKWEDAYARSYGIDVSDDGITWREVYATTRGRGGDEIAMFEPVTARWIRVDLRTRATKWGFSLYEVEINPEIFDARELVMAVSASSGQRDYAPELAVDGDMSTRWGSEFSDTEWWQVEFKEPMLIGGLNIQWEQAFAEKYSVEVSSDGTDWTTVYAVEEGDGRSDLLFFTPVMARYLRIDCRQRGTGWGNSIWEVRFYTGDGVPDVTASSTAVDSTPANALDGRLDSVWHSAGDDEQVLNIILPGPHDLGGIVIAWGDDWADAYTVEGSADGENWNELASVTEGSGGLDYHFFASTRLSAVRIRCTRSSVGQGYAIARIELKGGDEQATPLRHYTARARDADPHLYPMWLSRQQEFWTVVGLPEEPNETLIGETGMIEPKKGSFGVQPFVMHHGSLVSWADVRLEQHLEEDFLPVPSVTWSADAWTLSVAAVMAGEKGARFTAVRYRFVNSGTEVFEGKLALAIRPIQLTPSWQHGGFSPIPVAAFTSDPSGSNRTFFDVNGTQLVALVTPPERTGASSLTDGEISNYLKNGTVPPAQTASDAEGKVGAAMLYDITTALGATTDVVVAFPLYPGSAYPDEDGRSASDVFDELRAANIALWRDMLSAPHIDIPEKRLVDVLKSNLGYVMINRDGPWFKPGPRNYNHAWMRDGVLTGLATMRCGVTNMVHDFIVEFAKHIRADGWVPWMILETGHPITFNPDPASGEGQEYDSQGQFPFIVRQYYDYTGDEDLVRRVYPKVVVALRYARTLRERRMTADYRDGDKRAYYGILPLSNSHEGYYPAKHSHWDNFWLLRGLKDGAYLADRLGHEEDAAWIRGEEKDVREKLYASIMTTIRQANLDIIPGCVELADTDPTSTSIAVMIAEEEGSLPQPYGTNTFEHYWDELHARMQPGGEKLFTPYEVRNGDVFVRLGWRERALAQLRYFTGDSTRPHNWNHMAEVVHDKLRTPAYIGDMPHTWVGSDYINAVRTLFAYEKGDELILAAGIDPAWLDDGIAVTDLPTQFGHIMYDMKKQDETVIVAVSGDANVPGGIRIPVPESLVETLFIVNGKPAILQDGALAVELPNHH